MPRSSYLVFTYQGLRGDKARRHLESAFQALKIHKKVNYEPMKGKSDVQLAAVCKRYDPTAVLLVGRMALERVRPDLEIKRFHGRPFLLDLRRKAVDAALATATFHPKRVNEKRKFYGLLNEDINAWWHRSRKKDPLKDWPRTCGKCDLHADHFDYEGVGFCDAHWAGPEPPQRVEELTLFDAA